MRISVEVGGIKETLAEFNRFDLEMTKAIKSALTRSANRIRKTARALAPMDPDHDEVHADRPNERLSMNLRQSIKLKYSNDRFSVSIYPRRYYAHWVEFGTEHSRAQPFLHPAYDREVGFYIKTVRKAIQKVMDKRNGVPPKVKRARGGKARGGAA
jgi:HK97 gp10 family phage protein